MLNSLVPPPSLAGAALDAEFPALGGVQVDASQTSTAATSGTIGGAINDPLQQNNPFQQPSAQDQLAMQYAAYASQRNGVVGDVSRPDFAIQKEDFPALPGSTPGPPLSMTMSGFTPDSSSGGGVSGSVGMSGAIAASASSALLDPVAQGELQYGLLGLLGVIRMENENMSKLALGMDLTTLGLNLNSSDLLHRDMVSPFEEGRPAYVPACYAPPPVGTGPQLSLQQEHFGRYHLETLFYIFYAMPHDGMQVLAAKELFRRDWNYHTELKMWFASAQQQQQQTDPNAPKYMYFDVAAWERRLFTGKIQGGIEAQFMDERHLNAMLQQQS